MPFIPTSLLRSYIDHNFFAVFFWSLLVFSKLFLAIPICAQIVDFTKNILKCFKVVLGYYYYLA